MSERRLTAGKAKDLEIAPRKCSEVMVYHLSYNPGCLPSAQRPRSALAIPGVIVDPASS